MLHAHVYSGPQLRLSCALQKAEPAVFVDKTTRVICQGITGKNGTFHTEQVTAAGISAPLQAAAIMH